MYRVYRVYVLGCLCATAPNRNCVCRPSTSFTKGRGDMILRLLGAGFYGLVEEACLKLGG